LYFVVICHLAQGRKDGILKTMGEKESEAAAALARQRWKDTSDEERIAHSELMNAEKMKKTTAKQRTASAKKAAAARWGAKKKAGKKKAE
jgi:hypothetical protein